MYTLDANLFSNNRQADDYQSSLKGGPRNPELFRLDFSRPRRRRRFVLDQVVIHQVRSVLLGFCSPPDALAQINFGQTVTEAISSNEQSPDTLAHTSQTSGHWLSVPMVSTDRWPIRISRFCTSLRLSS